MFGKSKSLKCVKCQSHCAAPKRLLNTALQSRGHIVAGVIERFRCRAWLILAMSA